MLDKKATKQVTIQFHKDRNYDLTIDISQISKKIILEVFAYGLSCKANDSYVQRDSSGKEKCPSLSDKFVRFVETVDNVLTHGLPTERKK